MSSHTDSFVSRNTPKAIILAGLAILLVAAIAMAGAPAAPAGGTSTPVAKFGSIIQHEPSYAECQDAIAGYQEAIDKTNEKFAEGKITAEKRAKLIAKYNKKIDKWEEKCGFNN